MAEFDIDNIKDKTILGLVQLLRASEKERNNLLTSIENLKEKLDKEKRQKFCMTDKSSQISTAELSTAKTAGVLSTEAAHSNYNTRENVKNTETCVKKNADAERQIKDRRQERNDSRLLKANVDKLTGKSVAQSVDCTEVNVDDSFPEHKIEGRDNYAKLETLKSGIENDSAGESSLSSSPNDNKMNCHEMNRDMASGGTDRRTSTVKPNILCCPGHLQNSENVKDGENMYPNRLDSILGWFGSLVDLQCPFP